MRRAIRFYQKPGLWKKIQNNGMKIDFSWENSAQKYIDTYYRLANNI
jgi:starch synthase